MTALALRLNKWNQIDKLLPNIQVNTRCIHLDV